jgi:phosphoglycerate kinase
MQLKTLKDLPDVTGRRVLVRVDFNIPHGRDGAIGAEEDLRIRAALPTINQLTDRGARVIVASHLGRPDGPTPAMSLQPVAAHLGGLLGQPVRFVAAHLVDHPELAAKAIGALANGEVALLENLRFYAGEMAGDDGFAVALAKLADYYVNDAFAVCHRECASIVAVTRHLPSYAGALVAEEAAALSRLLERPESPYVVVMGGAKVSSKLPTLERLLPLADTLLIGGAMANNFFAAQGFGIGASLSAPEEIELARALLAKAGGKIVLPRDVVVAAGPDARPRVAPPTEVHADEAIYDIGPATMREWSEAIRRARTIAWNGPLGLFEQPTFAHGSITVGRAIAARAKGPAFGVVGGGETVQCLMRTDMAEWVDHVSTGGGAMLEFLAGKPLPGLVPLMADGGDA